MSTGHPYTLPPFMLYTPASASRGKDGEKQHFHRIVNVDSFEALQAVAAWNHTVFSFKGTRKAEHWEGAEALFFDVDNDHGGPIVTPETIKHDFPGVAFCYIFSRNNGKPKDGKPATVRFHVYFPVVLNSDAEDVKGLIRRVWEAHPYFDEKCLDLGRMIFGVANPQGAAVPGDLTLDSFMERQTAAPAAPAALTAPATSAREIPAGERNATLTAYAFTQLRRCGPEGIAEAEAAFLRRAEDCNPPLSDGELSTIWHYAVQNAPAKIWNKPGYLTPAEYAAEGFPVEVLSFKLSDLSDVAEGALFAENTAGAVLYNASLGWLVWDGCRYQPDEGKARLLAQNFTGRQLKAATNDYPQAAGAAANDPDNGDLAAKAKRSKNLLTFVNRCRSTNGLNHLLTEAAPHLACAVDDLDADPYALNTPAGIVDLRTGELHPSDPAALCTKATAVTPGTEGADLWRGFLETITCGDVDLADYLQTVAGMAALGKVFTETLLIATGDGGNGKSTFFNTLARVLGDYSTSVRPALLMTGNQNNGAELAALRGVRLALAAETEEGQRLDVATVKALCSTDRVAANPKYKSPFSFTPSHTLVLYTNFLPRVGSSDRGTWSRLTVLPFNAHLRDTANEKKDFAEILFTQAGGAVLSWMVEGARRFIANGYKLAPPAIVREALADYRKSCDWLGAFIEEDCELGENYAVSSKELYQRYTAYCQVNGDYRRDSRDFTHAMQSAGFELKHARKGNQYLGLRLKSDFTPEMCDTSSR